MTGVIFVPETTEERRSLLTRVYHTIQHRRQEQIAYRLWEEDGRQEGLSDHYWQLAGEEIRRQEFIQANIDNENLVGHSGAEVLASGAIYRPYVPLVRSRYFQNPPDDVTIVENNRRWPGITFSEYVNWRLEGF